MGWQFYDNCGRAAIHVRSVSWKFGTKKISIWDREQYLEIFLKNVVLRTVIPHNKQSWLSTTCHVLISLYVVSYWPYPYRMWATGGAVIWLSYGQCHRMMWANNCVVVWYQLLAVSFAWATGSIVYVSYWQCSLCELLTLSFVWATGLVVCVSYLPCRSMMWATGSVVLWVTDIVVIWYEPLEVSLYNVIYWQCLMLAWVTGSVVYVSYWLCPYMARATGSFRFFMS